MNIDEVEDIGYIDEKNIYHKTLNSKIETLKPIIRENQPNKIETLKPFIRENLTNKEPIRQVPKRKNISYDDLLSNMGVQLVNGKLELFNKSLIGKNIPPVINKPKNYTDIVYQQNRMNQSKHFSQPQPIQQMTKEQYKKKLQIEYIKNLQERERINQIKSKKLLFSNPSTHNNIRLPQVSSVNPNRLFNLLGR